MISHVKLQNYYGNIFRYYKLIAILRRQYRILLTASWEKIYIPYWAESSSDGAQYDESRYNKQLKKSGL